MTDINLESGGKDFWLKMVLFLSCVFLVFSQASSVLSENLRQEITVQYDKGLDQAVELVIAGSTNTDGGIYIVKKYLSPRKAKVNPERSKYVEIVIRDGKNEVPLLKVPADKYSSISSTKGINGEYILSVTIGGEVEKYRYLVGSQKIEEMNTNELQSPTGVQSKAILSNSNSIFVLSSNTSELKYLSKLISISSDLEELAKAETLYQVPNAILEIKEIFEADGKQFILGSGFISSDRSNSFIWIITLTPGGSGFHISASRYDLKKSTSFDARFISTAHMRPAIHLMARSEHYQPPEDFILNDKLDVLWHRKSERLTGDDISITGICSKDFAILEKKKTGKITDSINLSVVTAAGKLRSIEKYKMVNGGTLVNALLQPLHKSSVYVYANFDQMENVRRKDGWYSWLGYKVSRFQLGCD